MKLKNKQTGEIATLTLSSDGEKLLLMKDNEIITRDVKLSDLDEWEDVPEESVKPYWFINGLNGEPMKCDLKNCGKSNFIKWGEYRKQIGNYFETRKEAEKAVEKLKAWKRLKDKGFEFDYWEYEFSMVDKPAQTIIIKANAVDTNNKDLDLLFGGEE